MKVRTSILLSLALVPLFLPLNGWVVSVLWGWFVVPLGVPSIGVWAAAGIALVASYLTTNKPPESADNDAERLNEFATTVGYALLKPLFALALGGLIYLLAS